MALNGLCTEHMILLVNPALADGYEGQDPVWFYEEPAGGEEPSGEAYFLDAKVWDAMGRPVEVTVSVKPGNQMHVPSGS
jgi:hypothetical protein